jgi:hypothetical protein
MLTTTSVPASDRCAVSNGLNALDAMRGAMIPDLSRMATKVCLSTLPFSTGCCPSNLRLKEDDLGQTPELDRGRDLPALWL